MAGVEYCNCIGLQ